MAKRRRDGMDSGIVSALACVSDPAKTTRSHTASVQAVDLGMLLSNAKLLLLEANVPSLKELLQVHSQPTPSTSLAPVEADATTQAQTLKPSLVTAQGTIATIEVLQGALENRGMPSKDAWALVTAFAGMGGVLVDQLQMALDETPVPLAFLGSTSAGLPARRAHPRQTSGMSKRATAPPAAVPLTRKRSTNTAYSGLSEPQRLLWLSDDEWAARALAQVEMPKDSSLMAQPNWHPKHTRRRQEEHRDVSDACSQAVAPAPALRRRRVLPKHSHQRTAAKEEHKLGTLGIPDDASAVQASVLRSFPSSAAGPASRRRYVGAVDISEAEWARCRPKLAQQQVHTHSLPFGMPPAFVQLAATPQRRRPKLLPTSSPSSMAQASPRFFAQWDAEPGHRNSQHWAPLECSSQAACPPQTDLEMSCHGGVHSDGDGTAQNAEERVAILLLAVAHLREAGLLTQGQVRGLKHRVLFFPDSLSHVAQGLWQGNSAALDALLADAAH